MALKTSTKPKAKGFQSDKGAKSPAKKAGPKTAAKRASTSVKSKSTKSKASSKPVAKAARKAASKSADLKAHLRLLTEKIASLENKIQEADKASQSSSTPADISPPAPAIRRQKTIPVYEVKEVHPIDLEIRGTHPLGVDEDEDGLFTGLFDRARVRWLMGDWEALSKLDLNLIQHHPDRAKLALLVAAGLMQAGQTDRAKQQLAQAYNWGVPKKLAFSILYSGIRHSLLQATNGKARSGASLTNEPSSIQLGSSSSTAPGADAATILSKLSQLHEAVESLSPLLKNEIKTLADELIRVRKYLDAVIQREVKDTARQVQASATVQHYLATGELLPFHPESDTWPISPDFAFTLIQQLETRDYDLIVEFGSGLSTVLVARCLAKLNQKRHGKPPVRFLSFDHLPEFHGRTLSLLQQAGLADRVELCLAPLADYSAPNGRIYSYYTYHERLAAFANDQPLAGLKVLAIVDGPPAATGEHARYPAGPILAQAFAHTALDILLDDFIREDEKQVAKLWEEEFCAAGRSCTTRIFKLQKAACLLQVF